MVGVCLDRKVAIIAGASRGMGREIAIAYALAGARGVTVTAARLGRAPLTTNSAWLVPSW